MGGTNAKGRTAYTTRRCRQMDAPLHSSHFLDHLRGRRLSAGASPCRRIPRGGAVPSQACSICGASSTRVAAKAFCVATDILLHHRFSHANAADLRRRGAASSLVAVARSPLKRQVVSLHLPPTSPTRTKNLHRLEDTNSGLVLAFLPSMCARATPGS